MKVTLESHSPGNIQARGRRGVPRGARLVLRHAVFRDSGIPYPQLDPLLYPRAGYSPSQDSIHLSWPRSGHPRAGSGHPRAGYGDSGAGYGDPGAGYGYPGQDMAILGLYISILGLDVAILGLAMLGAGGDGGTGSGS